MGGGAGRKLDDVLSNAAKVVAVELLCAVQGMEQRAPLEPAAGTAAIAAQIREHVAPLREDRPIGPEIELVAGLIERGGLE